MSSITLNLEEKQLIQLRVKAKEMNLSSVEELLIKIAGELAESQATTFEAAMQYVLEKNQELYKRLA